MFKTKRFAKFIENQYFVKKGVPLSRRFATSHFLIYFSMPNGTVKFFNESKGFGFIVDNSSKEELFVHASGLIDNIREGDEVTFDTERGQKGMNAVNVKIA